ncbi:MAG: helix-turn-helix domain-containing protein [Solirubrobacterales bacterium]
MTDFLDEKRQEIRGRLAELKPLVDEYSRLEAAAAALEGVGGAAPRAAAAAAPVRRGPGRPKGSGRGPGRPKGSGRGPGRPKGSGRKAATAAATATPAAEAAAAPKAAPARRGRPPGSGRKAGRRKGSGTRSAEALAIVREQPGVTIPELAARMGIKQNYLYRVLPSLEQENKVAKQGRGWHPKAA